MCATRPKRSLGSVLLAKEEAAGLPSAMQGYRKKSRKAYLLVTGCTLRHAGHSADDTQQGVGVGKASSEPTSEPGGLLLDAYFPPLVVNVHYFNPKSDLLAFCSGASRQFWTDLGPLGAILSASVCSVAAASKSPGETTRL